MTPPLFLLDRLPALGDVRPRRGRGPPRRAGAPDRARRARVVVRRARRRARVRRDRCGGRRSASRRPCRPHRPAAVAAVRGRAGAAEGRSRRTRRRAAHRARRRRDRAVGGRPLHRAWQGERGRQGPAAVAAHRARGGQAEPPAAGADGGRSWPRPRRSRRWLAGGGFVLHEDASVAARVGCRYRPPGDVVVVVGPEGGVSRRRSSTVRGRRRRPGSAWASRCSGPRPPAPRRWPRCPCASGAGAEPRSTRKPSAACAALTARRGRDIVTAARHKLRLILAGRVREWLRTVCSARSSRATIPADRGLRGRARLAFQDINPQAPTHVLVMPRQHFSDIADLGRDPAAAGGLVARHPRLRAAGGARRTSAPCSTPAPASASRCSTSTPTCWPAARWAGPPAEPVSGRRAARNRTGKYPTAPVQWKGPDPPSRKLTLSDPSDRPTTSDRVSTTLVVPGEQAMVALLGSRDELLRVIESKPRQRRPRARQRDHHHRRARRQRRGRAAVRRTARTDQGGPEPDRRRGQPRARHPDRRHRCAARPRC